MSECADESPIDETSVDCLYSNDVYVSESGDDDEFGDQQQSKDLQNAGTDLSSSLKKTVRFNDRVQQTLFRPNSSILGQKKKHDRKQQQQQAKMKRKRTTSNSSVGSESKTSVSDIETDLNSGQLAETESTGQKKSKSDGQRFDKKKSAIMEGNNRYAGFLVGHRPVDQSKSGHQRHASGDSALGDDEDCDAGEQQIDETPARICISDTKDSGIDEFWSISGRWRRNVAEMGSTLEQIFSK